MNPLEITKGASLYVVLADAGIWVSTPPGVRFYAAPGSYVTLDPAAQKTAMNLQQRLIGFAPEGAVDVTTPSMVRGQEGLHTGAKN